MKGTKKVKSAKHSSRRNKSSGKGAITSPTYTRLDKIKTLI
jgi:hypothetical protein